MKKMMISMLVVLMLLGLTGCQWGAKNLGGSYNIDLPSNQKLVNVTWKDSTLWILTKDMSEEDKVETYTFQEDSNFGVLEGTVTIIESVSKDEQSSLNK